MHSTLRFRGPRNRRADQRYRADQVVLAGRMLKAQRSARRGFFRSPDDHGVPHLNVGSPAGQRYPHNTDFLKSARIALFRRLCQKPVRSPWQFCRVITSPMTHMTTATRAERYRNRWGPQVSGRFRLQAEDPHSAHVCTRPASPPGASATFKNWTFGGIVGASVREASSFPRSHSTVH